MGALYSLAGNGVGDLISERRKPFVENRLLGASPHACFTRHRNRIEISGSLHLLDNIKQARFRC